MLNKMDYRPKKQELRKELFKKYYHWTLKTNDCDPAMFMMNYVNRRMELNIEQRYWFAWLYANTYNVSTAWILFNEFPDFENVNVKRLTAWNHENYKRLRYQVDNKWQKGHLPAMFQSYSNNVYATADNQKQYFESLLIGDSNDNFTNCQTNITKNFFKFGRYLSWFYLQTLKETCDLDVCPDNLLLKEDSSKSHRNGLIFALAFDDVLEEDSEIKPNSKDFLSLLDAEADIIMKELESEHKDVNFDYFTMETSLCAYKKFFRKKHGRYPGYYLDRQAEDIKKCEGDNWSGIDWNLLWDARNETIDKRLLGGKVEEKRMWELIDKGDFDRLEWFTP